MNPSATPTCCLVALLALLPTVALAQPLTREQKVRNDRKKVEAGL